MQLNPFRYGYRGMIVYTSRMSRILSSHNIVTLPWIQNTIILIFLSLPKTTKMTTTSQINIYLDVQSKLRTNRCERRIRMFFKQKEEWTHKLSLLHNYKEEINLISNMLLWQNH